MPSSATYRLNMPSEPSTNTTPSIMPSILRKERPSLMDRKIFAISRKIENSTDGMKATYISEVNTLVIPEKNSIKKSRFTYSMFSIFPNTRNITTTKHPPRKIIKPMSATMRYEYIEAFAISRTERRHIKINATSATIINNLAAIIIAIIIPRTIWLSITIKT